MKKIIDSLKKGCLDVTLWLNYNKKNEPYFRISIRNGYKNKSGAWLNPSVSFTPNQGNTAIYGIKKMIEKHYEIINKNREVFAKRRKTKNDKV